MNCNDVREQLIDVVKPGAVESRPEIATHLTQCAGCTEALASMQKTMALLDEWQAPETSPYFHSKLNACVNEIRREEAEGGWFAWIRRPVVLRPMLAAAMVVVMVFGLNLYNSVNAPLPDANKVVTAPAQKGTAVADLQNLDKNQDLISDFDLLDEVGKTPDKSKTVPENQTDL